MSAVPTAAFNPIFWIHHCVRHVQPVHRDSGQAETLNSQIDRLFAIWQTVNKEHWFPELPPKERVQETEGLVPFRRWPLTTDTGGRYWTPALARHIEVLRYTYPDLLEKKNAEEIRAAFEAK